MPISPQPLTPSNVIEPSPDEWLANQRSVPTMAAINALDDDADEAGESTKVGKAIGVPPEIVNTDLEGYQAQHKADLTRQLFSNNEFLRDYVKVHPLGASVSNDDWGQLDKVSGVLQNMPRANAIWQSLKGVLQSYGQDFTHGFDNVSKDEFDNHPLRASIQAGLNTGVGIGATTLNAPFEFITENLGRIAKAWTGSDEIGQDVAEKTAGLFDAGTMALISAGMPIPEIPAEALLHSLPWVKDGKTPPAGIHPELDKLKQQANQAGLKSLDEAVKEAQSSTTKDRAPDMFSGFVEQHVGNAHISISGERALQLYGDKVPEADDGLLGWAPGIAEQLEVAKDTGADVSIPIKDYVANVDPAVHKELHDDIRTVEGGTTNTEAKDALPPIPTVGESVPVLRQSAGLEPLFSIGDRKLTLSRMAEPAAKGPFGPEQGFHDFDIVNENSQNVGSINLSAQKGGKELYVENINGIGQYYHPNNFGPSLMRDLLRQIKQAFPDAETLTGHRVSGARGEAGTYDQPLALPKVKLSEFEPNGVENFSKLLGGAWHSIGDDGLQAYIKPEYAEHEQDLIDAVHSELDTIAPKGVALQPASKLRYEDKRPLGAYQQQPGEIPVIAWALNEHDPIGVARHEAIHHLRQAGFFKVEEWNTLEQAAEKEGWLEKFGIERRYGQLELDNKGKIEEAIADAYKQWASESDERERQGIATSPVDKVFQKLRDFLEAIKEHVRRITGKENFNDVFSRVHEGEVGGRDVAGVEGEGTVFSDRSISEPGQGIDVRSPFAAAKDVGMTLDQHKRYMKLIEARQQSDLRASTNRVLAEQTKRQSAEWKSQSEAMRPEVLAQLNQRPDIAADKFFGLGELMGQKLDKTYRLDWDSLTPEQRKAIPESYTVRKGGVKPDEVANLFGYPTGDAMIEGLSQITQARESMGLRRDRFMRRLVDDEITKRMEIQHGFLEKNIQEETLDQVLSENQLQLLHEERMKLAMDAGENPQDGLTLDALRTQLKKKFDQLPMGSVTTDKYMREAGKQGKLAELSLLQEKPADAFKAKQVQLNNMINADFARTIEKAKAKLDKAAKPFRKADIKNVEPEYLNHIQDLLSQGGYKVGRSLANIQENLGRQQKTLEQFANEKLSESFGYRDIPIADVIVDKAVKPVNEMTTHDFMGYKQTVDALIKNGKDEQKIIREGQTADRQAVLDEMKKHIKTFPLIPHNETPTMWDKLKSVPNSAIVTLIHMRTFLNRMSRRDPESVFNRYVTYPSIAADARKSALQREYGAAYRGIGELKDMDKLVSVPFLNSDGQQFIRFTRNNLMTVIHNLGNDSNARVLTGSFIDPATRKAVTVNQLRSWAGQVSTPDMWDRAQKMGKDVFGQLIKLVDQEYEHIHGITIDKIPLTQFANAHGTFDGWYHPLIKSPIREGKADIRGGAYDDSDFGHITTANGYTKKRSGTIYPLDLNPDSVPVRINQMVHDIAFRSFVLETQKLFKDPDLSNTIRAHYGVEYNGSNFLLPWLRGIAGAESTPSKPMAAAARLSDAVRQNVIGTYIGFNPFTALKHGPTAWAFSMREVGALNFLSAVKDLYGRSPELGLSNSEFAMKNSEVLQGRERHWQDTLFGAHNVIQGSSGIREQILEKGSWLVAKSDMASAKPTWLAAFRTAQEDGLSMGDSVTRADVAVINAHGSMSITNQPAIVREGGALSKWMTSLYGFFGNVLQRQMEIAHDINDTYGFVKQGEINKAAANIPSIATNIFTYVILPAYIEEKVTGLTSDDRRGLGEKGAELLLRGVASPIPYVRDIVNGIMSGNDPGAGLISSLYKDIKKAVGEDLHKDALTRQRMGKTVGDTLTAFGHLSGMAPKTVDNAIHFGIDLVNGQANPKSAGDWLRGITKGTTKERVEK